MKSWNCLKTLTKLERRRSTTITHGRELPCLVENFEESRHAPVQDQPTTEQLEQLANDSTEGFCRVSCLRFAAMSSDNENDCLKSATADMKCWKKSQTYHVPSISPKLWKVLAKILGIPLYPGDKPYLATILHVLTFASSLCFMISNLWYTVSDMKSDEPKKTALKQCVMMVLFFFWALLVIYSHKLAYRMLTHQSFVKYVKMHSKTILKCKTSYLIIFFGILFAAAMQYDCYEHYQTKVCDSADTIIIVYKIFFITGLIFSIFSCLWTVIVAVLILSVCRTHCLEIRQFIRELEKDAIAHDEVRRRTYSTLTLLSNIIDDAVEMENIESQSSSDETSDSGLKSLTSPAIYIIPDNNQTKNTRNNSLTAGQRKHTRYSESHMGDHILKTEEILHQMWKIQCSLRITSSAFKRWLICFLCLGVIWLAIWLVAWLSESPTPISIIAFLTPLIWFSILSSAVAEVNNECQRTLRFLCPTEDRLKMLIHLNNAPVQMAIYGFAIKYSNLVTYAVGLVVALISGVVLQEIKSL